MRVNWTPSPSELRKWALFVGLATGVIGSVFFFSGFGWVRHFNLLAYKVWGLGCLCFTAGMIGGRLGIWVYRGWMSVAFLINRILSVLLLGSIYFAVLTPMGVVSKLLRRDKLQLGKEKMPSYWRKLDSANTSGIDKQF